MKGGMCGAEAYETEETPWRLSRCLCNVMSPKPTKEQSVHTEGWTKVFTGFWKGDTKKILFKECRLLGLSQFIFYLGHLNDEIVKAMLFLFQWNTLLDSSE